MSATETMIEEPAAQTDERTASDPGMGGTSTEDQTRAGGEDGEQPQENAEGAEPAGGAEEGVQPAPSREAPELPEDVRKSIENADFISRTILSNPERERMFRKWAQEDGGGGPAGEDAIAASEAAIGKWFKDGEQGENLTALREVLTPLHAEIRRLSQRVNSMQAPLQQAHEAAASGAFQRGLVENGLPASTLSDKGFLKHLSEQRRDPEFRKASPAYQAKVAAATWFAKTGQRAANTAARQHVADVKGGRLYAASNGHSTNGASKVHVIVKNPGYDAQVLAIRAKDPTAKFEYRDPK